MQCYVPVYSNEKPLHKVNRSMYKGVVVHYDIIDISNDKYSVMKTIHKHIKHVHSNVVKQLSGVFDDMKVNKKISYYSY